MKLFSLRFLFRNYQQQNNSHTLKNINLTKNYYKILEVDINACETIIKKSYLRLAKQLHPDVNPQGHLRFTEIQEAYNVLSEK
jgi:hypothetical protein